MKQVIYIVICFLATACADNNEVESVNKLKPSDSLLANNNEVESVSKLNPSDSLFADTASANHLLTKKQVRVDYIANKDLLDIILLLPDSSFSSWGWPLKDRFVWYNEIKLNNFYTDDNPDFFTQKYFEPNAAGFSIVDGFWSISIYKTNDNSHVVITNDVVGDGNTIYIFEAKSNKLKAYLSENALFDYVDILKRKNDTVNCEGKLSELDDPIFNYDFSDTNKVEIESAWYLIEEKYKNCLIGNSVLYRFNPRTKIFDIEKVYWKPKQNI